MFKEYIKIAIKSLRKRPVRSWLTIIGVVIGVFLIMSLLSMSEGIKTAMLQQLSMLGKDLVMIFPGDLSDIMAVFIGGMELTEDNLKAIKKAEGVDILIPFSWKGVTIRHQGEVKTVLLCGVSWRETLEVLKAYVGWDLKEGHWPIPGKRELAVGYLVPKDIFPKMKIGSQVFVKGKQFKIAGILKSLGNKQDDSQVYLDLDIFREITGERRGANFALAKIKPGFSVGEAEENIKESLEESKKRRKGEDVASFTVLSSEKMGGIVENIMALIQVAIFAFASIAIVVGAIGIMNTMYTSVHERIKEIGIMKAVGARSRTIVTIFLIESGFIGLIGGLGGIVLGLGLAKIIEIYFQIHPVFFFKAAITPQLILFGLGFSFIVGCISGFLPARKASKLKPVDALKYE